MDQTYIFVLGRNASLSVAEVKAVLKNQKISYQEVLETKEVLLVDSLNLDPLVLNKILGGTVKIGVVCGVSTQEELKNTLNVKFLTEKIFSQTEKKIQFGISIYDGGDLRMVESIYSELDDVYRDVKRELSGNGYSVRFAFQKERDLSSVTVSKNKLIQKGAEVMLIPTKEAVIIGKTLCVQEFEEFSKRDYGRPVRDMKSGVMPPKLARIMINLAQVSQSDTLLDPFCGSGTMLQEAYILGYKRILGRDVSAKAVSDSKENIHWLLDYHEDKTTEIDIQKADVKVLSQALKYKVHAIVAEPYLGPTLHKEPSRPEFEKIRAELERLYIGAFSEFHKILEQDGVVVFILPVFQRSRQKVHLDILSRIEKLGFRKIPLDENLRGSITVGNKHDFVLREIVKFQKN